MNGSGSSARYFLGGTILFKSAYYLAFCANLVLFLLKRQVFPKEGLPHKITKLKDGNYIAVHKTGLTKARLYLVELSLFSFLGVEKMAEGLIIKNTLGVQIPPCFFAGGMLILCVIGNIADFRNREICKSFAVQDTKQVFGKFQRLSIDA